MSQTKDKKQKGLSKPNAQVDPEKGVPTSLHESLSDNQKIAEDLFNLAYHAMKTMELKNVKWFQCKWDYESVLSPYYQIFAILDNKESIHLDFYDCIDKYDDERNDEMESLLGSKRIEELLNPTDDRKTIREIDDLLEKESKKYFAGKESLFLRDSEY